MELNIESVRQLKNSSGRRDARVVTALAEANREKVGLLRSFIDTGRLFRIPVGSETDLLLLESALLAVVLSDVSGYDPESKKRQLAALRQACAALGVQYEEVLRLTESEPQILASLREQS